MINYQGFVNDMTQREITPTGYALPGGSQARLFCFSPSILPQQVLRPYTYNFGAALVQDIISAPVMHEAVAPGGSGIKSEAINCAILPDANGILLDTRDFSQQWTFVLVMDILPMSFNSRQSAPGPTNKIVASGYCTQEPINPATRTPNPGAVLVFTRSNMTRIQTRIGVNGPTTNITNTQDVNIVSQLNGMLSPDTDLYIGTPGDIRNIVTASSGGEAQGAYGALALSNIGAYEKTRQVPGMIKVPKQQLGNIVHALNKGVEFANMYDENIDSDAANIHGLQSPYDQAKETFNCNVVHSMSCMPTQGIDVSKPLMMMELIRLFPTLDIIPYRIPATNPYDSTPQNVVTRRNQMSAMLAAAFSNLVPTTGLANITFRYSSYIRPNMYASPYEGTWEIKSFSTLVEVGLAAQTSMINTIKMYAESELFPILRIINGDFDLLAYINISGEILIDLCYLDDHDSAQLGVGFYTTSARLGGLIDPMVGGADTITHNALQLDGFAESILAAKCGSSLFNRPIISTPQFAPPMQPTNRFSSF